MNTQLNFINNTNVANNPEIVIFQKNIATSFNEMAVAWLVIKNCGYLGNHPFTFPMSMQVGASDSYGNYTPQLTAQNGQMFQMAMTSSGDCLEPAGSATNSKEVQVLRTVCATPAKAEVG